MKDDIPYRHYWTFALVVATLFLILTVGILYVQGKHGEIIKNLTLVERIENDLAFTGRDNIKSYAYFRVQETWDSVEWSSFDTLIKKESGWVYTAQNSQSSAYGLCQTMMSLHEVAPGFSLNPQIQIDWCIRYIQDTYETPSLALIFHKKNNWF